MRSLLFVPGDSEDRLEEGFAAGADVVIVDLEASVARANKQRARELASKALLSRGDTPTYVRVNSLATGMTEEDLAAVAAAGPDGIILPRSQGGADIQQLSAMLRVAEAEAGIQDGATAIIPIITDTALATLSAANYAAASPRLAGLAWDTGPLSADIGARAIRDENGSYIETLRLARSLTLLSAAAAGLPAIDAARTDISDTDALRAECFEAERDGFSAKLAIHPAQVAIINAVFTPSPESVSRARTLVAAFEANGLSDMVEIEGQIHDLAQLKRAQRLLARARAAAIRPRHRMRQP